MTIREEFEKAYWAEMPNHEVGDHDSYELDGYALALWAAKWMAERSALIADEADTIGAAKIRQLAKELEP